MQVLILVFQEHNWENASGLHRGGVGSILGDRSPYNEGEAVVIAVVLFSVIVVTIVGNILVCVAVCLVRKLRRPCNYLLVSLAVSDLCVAILVMPLALLYEILGTWPFGNVLCDVWVSFDVLSCTASILNLCMISVDRYCAITKPLEYGVKRTPRRMIVCVSLVWLGAACISLPPLLILGNEHGDDTECTVCLNFWYQIYATLGSFYIPLCIMIVVYYKIFRAARKIVLEERKAQSHLKANKSSAVDEANHKLLNHHKLAVTEITRNGTTTTTTTTPSIGSGGGRWGFNKNTHNDSSWSLGDRGSSVGSDHYVTGVRKKSNATKSKIKFALAKERKASTTLGIIMSAFTICWFPFFVLALVRPFLSDPLSIPHSLSSLFLWLGYANSLLNPIIYATLNKDFRKPFQEILCLRCSSLNLMMREEFYYSQYGDPDITIAYQTTRYRPQYEEDSPALQTDSTAEQQCPLAPERSIVKDNESFL